MHPPVLSRRYLLKLGVAGGGWVILRPGETVTQADGISLPASPYTTPFIDELPLPGIAIEVEPFFDIPAEYLRFWVNVNTTRFFKICAEERAVKLHSELPPTVIWGYRDLSPAAEPTVGAGSLLPLPDQILGPTIVQLFGQFRAPVTYACPAGSDPAPIGGGYVIRHENHLPKDHTGFGVPRTTIHLHGGHHLARADGFPDNLETRPDIPDGWPCFIASEPPGFKPPANETACTDPHPHPPVNEVSPDGRVITERQVLDYFYPQLDPGALDLIRCQSTTPPDSTERPSTQWYHDHLLDFTGPNAYRGQAGFVLCFDEVDSNDENDPNPVALRLPSAPYDVPFALQDKRIAIAPDGKTSSLVFSSFDHDGFLGDKFCVNGKVQPYLEVKRRKYRFRFLNGSNARIYRLFINDGFPFGKTYPMDLIATEGGLLSRPLRGTISLLIAMAERLEVVFDFSTFPTGTELFLENRLPQSNGRKPDDGLLSQGSGSQLVKFIVTGDPPQPDNSRVPDVLRPFEPISAGEIAHAYRRRFRFERTDGAWAINERFAGDLERPIASPVRGQPEIWTLENSSGGWWHPIHIHSEFFRVLKRNGQIPTITARNPVVAERDGLAKRDTILLKGGDTVDVFLKFRDHLGPFVFHCHNMEHEDMAMMARFDVIP
jgi:FtsP/CotA-like multicopper oxidase with cupredoxin domain